MTSDREPRDRREPDDPRDERDAREPDDPRDPRDPRLEGDPRLTGETNGGIPLFVKVVAIGIVFGLIGVSYGAWQISKLRADQERRACRQAVADRIDDRAMWIWLSEQFPQESLEIGLQEQLDTNLPLLKCSGSTPIPLEES
jgi:hypothetical protein